MKELIDDITYKMLKNKYDELLLDYVILEANEEYKGELSHKQAVIEALAVLNSRIRVGNSLNHPRFFVDEDKMICTKCNIEDFFSENDKLSEYMSYWSAFSKPPYDIPYDKDDFRKINYSLFPITFRNDLEIYTWNDDFSNYFDDGKEWWGTALWSVYDKYMNRFVIIGASLTD